jgi:hypothetical protein
MARISPFQRKLSLRQRIETRAKYVFRVFWGGCLLWDIRRENIVFDHPPNLINLVLSREEIVL